MPNQIPIVVASRLLKEFLAEINKILAKHVLSCFIAYSWSESNNKIKVSRLAEDLHKAGIFVFLDVQHNNQINSSIPEYIENIRSVNYVIVAGSKSLHDKYYTGVDCILSQEIAHIHSRFDKEQRSIVGISLNDDIRNCLPNFLKDTIIKSYTNSFDVYAKTTLELLEYFAPDIAKQAVNNIIKDFQRIIQAMKYNMSPRNLFELQLISPQQLKSKIATNIDDVLKKNYLKKLVSENSCNFEKMNSLKSFVYLSERNDANIISKTGECTHNDLIDHLGYEGHKTKRMVIQGDPGIGKSTLCKLIVYLWASNEKLLDFKFVFFIKASNLNKSRYPFVQGKNYTELDIIFGECFLHQTQTEIPRAMLELALNNNHKILWLIDGSEGSISDIPDHLQNVFKSIINNPYVILTSRNHLDNPYNQNYPTIGLSVIGFNEDTQLSYVDLFFDSLNLTNDTSIIIKNNLLHFLKHNYLVKQLCLIPMYLEFVCNIWLKKLNNPNVNMSMTTLYKEIFMSLINKFLTEKEDLPPDNLRTEFEISNGRLSLPLLAIKEIAFFIHKKNCDVFTYDELKQHSYKLFNSLEPKQLFPCLFADILKIGIISRTRNGNDFKFVDPSLKIFFVAKYFIDGLQSLASLHDHQDFTRNFAWFVRNDKYIKNNDLLFAFVSGLLNSLNKNNYLLDKVFLKEATMLFWENIFSKNIDFVGINHICLLLRCLKETDYQLTFNKNPEIKSYINVYLPKILEYIRINNISVSIKMFLSVFSDPNTIEMIIHLDLLIDTLNFIAHTDENYSSRFLSHLLSMVRTDCREKILSFLYAKLPTTLDTENDIVSKYFALSIKDEPSNKIFLTLLLLKGSLKHKRTALKIIKIQKFYNKDIIMILGNLAENILPSKTTTIDDLADDFIERESLFCLCIDILCQSYVYNNAAEVEFLKVLKKTRHRTISHKIIAKMESICADLIAKMESTCADLKEDNGLWDAKEIYYDSGMRLGCSTDDEIENKKNLCEYFYIVLYSANPEEYTKHINDNYKSMDWKTIPIDAKIIAKLNQETLKFLIDHNIFLLNIPLIDLIKACAEAYPNNVSLMNSLAKLIIKRIFFNCDQEVLTIKNSGIIVYNEARFCLGIDKFKEGNFMMFIKEFTELFYEFANTHDCTLQHKKISFTHEKEKTYCELQLCRSERIPTYVCAYAEENLTHSEQSISDEHHSNSSASITRYYDSIEYKRWLSMLESEKNSDSEPQTPTSTTDQESIFTISDSIFTTSTARFGLAR